MKPQKHPKINIIRIKKNNVIFKYKGTKDDRFLTAI
jgi:hypothetical protein